MRKIDIDHWARRDHFEFFSGYDQPYFGLCANVEISELRFFVKSNELNMTAAIVYLISRAANAVPEFRQRIRNDHVVEHEVVHPSITILGNHDLFSFCRAKYNTNFAIFSETMSDCVENAKNTPTLTNKPGRDDYLFMTAIPWVSFTSFKHPLNLRSPDSIPRFAYGRFFEQNNKQLMPLAVQGHHALLDGIHAGSFYLRFEELQRQPDITLGDLES